MTTYLFLKLVIALCSNASGSAVATCVDEQVKCGEVHYFDFAGTYKPTVRKCFTIDKYSEKELGFEPLKGNKKPQ